MQLRAIDLFSGCGGLSTGLEQANIQVSYALELDPKIAKNYKLNHLQTTMIIDDIRNVSNDQFKKIGKNIDIVAGCPPCQGFTKINRKNKKSKFIDERNLLILEFFRAIKNIMPEFIMMENVPEIIKYDKFKETIVALEKIGYNIDYKIINVKNFGVPQNRNRLVLVGSRNFKVNFPQKTSIKETTVRQAIGFLPKPGESGDPLQKIYSHHTKKIQKIIEMIPKNGGSRKDLPQKYWLECHKKKNIGFTDVYGRMNWDKPSPTITGGCLSPSKGRFLHPEQNRSITLREAALLQGFPLNYKFDITCSKSLLAQMVGNAIPPKIAKFQGEYIGSLIKDNEWNNQKREMDR